MTTQTDYTPAEWDLLVGMPALIVRVMLHSEPYSPDAASSWIQPTLAAVTDLESPGLRSDLVESVIGALRDRHESLRGYISCPELMELRLCALDACRRAAGVLAQKAPEAEAEAYSAWLLAIGRQAALVSAYQPLPVEILKERAARQRVVLNELADTLTIEVATDVMCTTTGCWLPL